MHLSHGEFHKVKNSCLAFLRTFGYGKGILINFSKKNKFQPKPILSKAEVRRKKYKDLQRIYKKSRLEFQNITSENSVSEELHSNNAFEY